jgi:metal-responsive CopG/Arc/MetJ family transcriptional regulator
MKKRTKRSRSHLFSNALREYLARHSPEEIAEAMNRALVEAGETPDDDQFVEAAARRTLEQSEW